jgi:hypothetical protein
MFYGGVERGVALGHDGGEGLKIRLNGISDNLNCT